MFKNLMLAGLMLVGIVAPASAQGTGTTFTVHRQKSTWYTTPPELQILDERPVIHDFREAPAPAQQVQLPPGPQSRGGNGAGTPGGGGPQQMGSGGYRNFSSGAPYGLPSADLGHAASNIPVNGIRSSRPLPHGTYTGIHSKTAPIAAQSGPSGPRSMPAAPGAGPKRVAPPTQVASYGGYKSSGNSQSSSQASMSLNGKLLSKMK